MLNEKREPSVDMNYMNGLIYYAINCYSLLKVVADIILNLQSK